MKLYLLAIVIFAVSLEGCISGIKGVEVDEDTKFSAEGIRYYLPSPFLFVTENGDGNYEAELKFLPDRTREFTIQPYAYFSSNSSTIELYSGTNVQETTQAGTLKSIGLTMNSTQVPLAAIPVGKAIADKALDLDIARARDAANKTKEEFVGVPGKGTVSVFKIVDNAGEKAAQAEFSWAFIEPKP